MGTGTRGRPRSEGAVEAEAPSPPPSAGDTGDLLRLAAIHRQAGRVADARDLLRRAASRPETAGRAYLELGEIALEGGETGQAAQLAQLARSNGAPRLRAQVLLARAHAVLGRTAEARQLAEAVLAEEPDNAGAKRVLDGLSP
jgi:tetratricopeptide (TPR) repeat protein